jgi:hypothetical protein
MTNGLPMPVDPGLHLRATVRGGAVVLDWTAAPGDADVYYRVRGFPGPSDYFCVNHGGASVCWYQGIRRLQTRSTHAVLHPVRGTWTFRVTVGTNWLNDPLMGDQFLVSNPVVVTVR